jgi:hypothetical protein
MSYVLDLQNLESVNDPAFISSISLIGCISSWSVIFCFDEEA